MKEEALKLADLLAISGTDSIEREASAMIRRLVEELDKQDKPVAWSCWNEDMVDLPAIILFTEPDKYEWQSIKPLYTTPQTKPLSDEEINQIAKDELIGWACDEDMLSFARAIEEKHGIK